MNYRKIKSLSAEHKGLSIVIIAVTSLSILSILSFLFWDQSFFTWQRQNLSHFDKPLLMKALVQLGKAWLLIWLMLCWALLSKNRKGALIALLSLFMLIFTLFPLKTITHRPRPRDVIKHHVYDGSNIFHSWSFPSGDTSSAFAAAAAIAPFIGWPGRAIAFFLACCIGVLRVFWFAHYFSDIFAGAALGIIVAYLVYRLVISRPSLEKELLKLLNPRIILAAVIIIPVVTGLSNGADDLLVFSVFYPPIVAALYLLSKIKKSYAM